MPAIVIALIILESLLLFISALVRIPECTSVVVGGLLVLAVVFLWRSRAIVPVKKSLTVLSLFAVCWSLYSAYALPYWNSITYLDVLGIEYPESKGLDEVLSPEEAKQDYIFARKQLGKVHPAFLREAALYPEPLTEWADSISVCRLYQLLQTEVSSLRDAHTKVFPVLRETCRADFSAFGTVVSINGIPREAFVDSLGHYISSETAKWTEYRILSGLNNLDHLKLYGLFGGDSVSVVFNAPGGGQVRHTFHEKDFRPAGRTSSYSLSSDSIGGYGFNDTLSCGYLRLDNMYYYTSTARKRFREGMEALFTQLSQNGYKRLVIDLRGCPGGNADLAHELFRYLPVDEYSMGARYHRRGPVTVGGPVVRKNRNRSDLCFEGDVYVLTSVSTFSGAMHLADYLQGNGVARIVGESPGNTPTCYTNIAHYVLPNSRLSLDVSTGEFVRVDETREENIVKPDMPCEAGSAYSTLKENLLGEERGGL